MRGIPVEHKTTPPLGASEGIGGIEEMRALINLVKELWNEFLRLFGLTVLLLVLSWMAVFRLTPAKYAEKILAWTEDTLDSAVICAAQVANWPDQP